MMLDGSQPSKETIFSCMQRFYRHHVRPTTERLVGLFLVIYADNKEVPNTSPSLDCALVVRCNLN